MLADNRLDRLFEGALAEPQGSATSAATEQETLQTTSATLTSPEDLEVGLGLERAERRRIQEGLAALGSIPGRRTVCSAATREARSRDGKHRAVASQLAI